MKRLRVYLDTSVIGGCFDEEFGRWSNALMEDFRERRLIPVMSKVVATEIDVAPDRVRRRYKELLGQGAEVLEVSAEALDLAAAYAEHGIVPPAYRNDMLHIALATVANVDLLVSWNFKPIFDTAKSQLIDSAPLTGTHFGLGTRIS